MSGEQQPGATPVPAKEDPETLVLRGRPRPVIRFRKGLIIGLTAIVSAIIIALTWASLEPPTFRLVAEQDAGEQRSQGTPEAVAGAPAAYSDVPQLGPPLPGDLGRPILEQQRRLAAAEVRGDELADPERDRAAAERQRIAAEEQAARSAAVLVQLSKGPAAATPSPELPLAAGPAPQLPDGAAAGPRTGQQRKLEFAGTRDADVSPEAITGSASPWTLSAGTVIPASLVTGLNSDLPGMVVAQVTENVRDTATGRTILIPQGARLIGDYDSAVAFGQERALLVWKRLVFPDGSSVRLDKMPATDPSGYAGLRDKVDFHEWRLLKGIVLSSVLGVGGELGLGGGDRDLVRALRESAQTNGARAGDQIVSRNLDVQPTLTVRPGWPVRAIIHQDLVLRPWRG